MRISLRSLTAILAALFVVGSSAPARADLNFGPDSIPTSRPRIPDTALPLPLHNQETDYSCGAAALWSVLRYWGVYDGTERELFPLLQTTPKDGTEPPMLAKGAVHFGLHAEMNENMTLRQVQHALMAGYTVILSMQAWRDPAAPSIPWKFDWEDGHYAVLIGMDEEYLYLMDPSAENAYAYVPLREFVDRWHDVEDRHGYVWRFQHLAVLIHGPQPAIQRFETRRLVRQK